MKPVHAENWKAGANGSSVVSDTLMPEPFGIRGADATDYYGGYLVAESIAKPYITPIAAVPQMIRFIQRVAFDYICIAPAGSAEATDKQVLDQLTAEAREILKTIK